MRENFAGFDGCKSSAFVIRPAEPLREPEADEDDREKRRNVRSQLKGLRGGAGAGRGRKTIFPKWEKNRPHSQLWIKFLLAENGDFCPCH